MVEGEEKDYETLCEHTWLPFVLGILQRKVLDQALVQLENNILDKVGKNVVLAKSLICCLILVLILLVLLILLLWGKSWIARSYLVLVVVAVIVLLISSWILAL